MRVSRETALLDITGGRSLLGIATYSEDTFWPMVVTRVRTFSTREVRIVVAVGFLSAQRFSAMSITYV